MSGHLLPRDIFVRAGLLSGNARGDQFFKQVYFAGGDEQAIRAVQNGFVDAAGVSQYASLLLRPEERDQVVAISDSIESPAHLVMARRGLSEAICERVKQSLLALDINDPVDKSVLDKLYGVQGYAEAKLADFAAVAQIAARFGFVKKPELFAEKPGQ
jgi:ABC-type phosphate/phosphonate transport system substrate-binding protein